MRNETTSEEFAFTDSNNDGNYTFENLSEMPLITVGDRYKLSISYNSENYEAFSLAKRNVQIDTITYEFEEEELGQNAGYYAELFATDIGEKEMFLTSTESGLGNSMFERKLLAK